MLSRRQCLGVVLFVLLLAVGSQISFPLPGTDIPQSAQTVVVLLIGVFLGFNAAALTVFCYLVIGAAGIPVFADGGAGVATLFGPSGGYLIAFWFTASLLGVATDYGFLRISSWQVLLWMLLGHVLIVGIGAGLLSASVGLHAAWFNGVEPFIAGGVVKSLIAAVIIWLAGSARHWFLKGATWPRPVTRS